VGLSATVRWIIIGSATAWVVLAFAVALYGSSRGHPFFPLVVCALLPFPGWPLVLLAVAVAPRQPLGRRPLEPDELWDHEPPRTARDPDPTGVTRPLPVVPPPRRRR